MRQQMLTPLDQVMAWHQIGVKLSSEAILEYYGLEHEENVSIWWRHPVYGGPPIENNL